MPLDFSELQGTPAHTGQLDFSALGGIPAVGQDTSAEDTTALGAAGRGAVGMVPLGEQAYAGVESLVDKTPYLHERQELEKEIEADKFNHPAARMAGQAAGVVAPALLTGGASVPESLGGAATEGALMGAGFGTGNAIDTVARGGTGAQAAGDVALGTALGGVGGKLGQVAGNIAGKAIKPFATSQDELLAEATAGVLGGTTRQIRNLPGKNPVQTLVGMGKSMAQYNVAGEPLIASTDQMPARLNKFLTLQKDAGQTIGDTIKTSGVQPMAAQPIIDELNTALKFATPDNEIQMGSVIKQVQKYADTDGTIAFDRLQQLKSELGDEAFQGQGNPVLQSAYHVVSDAQDRELDRIGTTINKPAFDKAKEVYQITSRAIPMLRTAVAKEVGKKTSMVVPGAALLSGHPVVAAGALMKDRMGQIGSGAMFRGLNALPENAGASLAPIAGRAGAAAIQQNMGKVTPLPASASKQPTSTKTPNVLNVSHTALAPWKPTFARNAANAKDAAEVEKSQAVTDFILSQRDTAYAAAKQKAADEPEDQPMKMAEGGVVPDDFSKPHPEFGSTLVGLENQMKHPTHEQSPEPLNDHSDQKFHQPLLDKDFEEKLKAFLSKKED